VGIELLQGERAGQGPCRRVEWTLASDLDVLLPLTIDRDGWEGR